MNQIRTEQRQSGAQGAEQYGRERYEIPPSAAPNRSHGSSRRSFQPEVQDNGWASRRARSTSHTHPPLAMNPPAYGRQATGDPAQAHMGWSNYSMATRPTTSTLPIQSLTADPRLSRSPAPSAPPQQEIPAAERKLEFFLRTTEQNILRDRSTTRRWTRHHSDLVNKLIAEHQALSAGYSMRERTMKTALDSFAIFVECYNDERVDHDAENLFNTFRKGVQDIVLDLCEDAKVEVRKVAYRALLRMSQTDRSVAQHHCWFLAQLLQNDTEGELECVQDALAQHMELATSDWLKVVVDDLCFGDTRKHVIKFLDSKAAGRALTSIVDDGSRDAELARHLAPVLPVADQGDLLILTDVLGMFQNIWLDADEETSHEDKKAARDAAAAVLWNLCFVLMKHSKTFVSGPPEAPLLSVKVVELLEDTYQATHGVVIEGGARLFSEMIQLSRGMHVPECDVSQPKPSETKLWLNELEKSARYFFCVLPPSLLDATSGSLGTADTALHHFTPIQRILFFRSAANLAAKVVSAAKQSPPELGYPGESTATDMAKVAARALLAHVPMGWRTISNSDDRPVVSDLEAHAAYSMLAAEALFIVIHLCECYLLSIGSSPANLTNDAGMRDRVRALRSLASDIDRSQQAPTEVLEAVKVVMALGTAYFRVRERGETEYPSPEWLMEPPPLPAWEKPVTDIPTGPAAESSSSSRRRRRVTEDQSVADRQIRRRGEGKAEDYEKKDRDVKDSHEAASPPHRPDTGISIRGASRAGKRSPTRSYDAYPSEPLADRIKRREEDIQPRSYNRSYDSYGSTSYRSRDDEYSRHDGYRSSRHSRDDHQWRQDDYHRGGTSRAAYRR